MITFLLWEKELKVSRRGEDCKSLVSVNVHQCAALELQYGMTVLETSGPLQRIVDEGDITSNCREFSKMKLVRDFLFFF